MNSWREYTLGEICQKVRKTSRVREPKDSSFIYVDIASIDNNQLKIVAPRRYIWSDAPSRAQQILAEGDIVFSTVRPYLKNIAQVGHELDGAIASTGFCVIRPNPELVISKLLFYYVASNRFIESLNTKQRGTSYPAVRDGDLMAQVILLPSLPEQEKIVAKIEELFSEIDNAAAELLSATRLENTHKQAIIDSTFDTIAINHKMTTLNDIADIRGGVTKGRKLSNVDIVQIPYLRVANVQDGYLDLKEIKYIPGTAMDLEKYQLRYGDILFTEGGDKDKLGRGTVWRDEVSNCIHQNHIFRARVDLAKNDPEFISLAAQTTKSRHYFFSKAKQTTNLASINMTQLKLLEVPDVPIDVQQEALARINEMIDAADSIKKSLALCSDYSRSLKQSILSKAFKGELV